MTVSQELEIFIKILHIIIIIIIIAGLAIIKLINSIKAFINQQEYYTLNLI